MSEFTGDRRGAVPYEDGFLTGPCILLIAPIEWSAVCNILPYQMTIDVAVSVIAFPRLILP